MHKNNEDVTTIYVVRHGESESNVYAHENPTKPASHYGEFGSSLTQIGRMQIYELAKRLQHVHFSAFYSSHLARAKESAEIIAANYNLPVKTDREIRERFFGEPMSNVKKKEIEEALKTLNEQEKFSFKYFPNGESGHDVVNRFKKFINGIIPEYKNKTILIVSHGYVMRSFLISVGFAKFDELRGGTIKNAAYFVIKTDGKTFNITDRHGITRGRGYDDEE
ncbi:MAG TPA: histidine phosphatase family protein [Candidatus Saccharimonadales bacterium]|nr:histidine phosphatase family protein [Candidatus Saccharimonadales bacterium]